LFFKVDLLANIVWTTQEAYAIIAPIIHQLKKDEHMYISKTIYVLMLFIACTSMEAFDKNAKIFVAGHRGLVGSALVRRLEASGYANIIVRTSAELDLRDAQATREFFDTEQPEYVFLAAAKVGGIWANSIYPAEFIHDNLAIELNVIDSAYRSGVKKLVFLGSSCIYPRDCPQPICEEYLLTGALEETNKAYAVAKIAGIIMCQSYNKQYGTKFISCMPTNLYGPYDNFDLQNSHVLPALLRKMYEAKRDNKPTVTLWGSGRPYREFLYVDDLADAVVFLIDNYEGDEIVNIGTGQDVTIRELALTMQRIVGYEGELVFDASKPDGTPRKQLNVDKLTSLGWSAPTGLEDGIEMTYRWCLENDVLELLNS